MQETQINKLSLEESEKILRTLVEEELENTNYTSPEELEELFYSHNNSKFNNYIIKLEDQWGGEGQGDSYGIVLSITHNDQKTYIKYSGYYDSWNGVEWHEEGNIVEPIEKICIHWEEK